MKKILFFLLLALGLQTQAVSAYTDVTADTEHSAAITWLTDAGVIQGYSDGRFEPDKEVNRAEFVKILGSLKDRVTPLSPTEDCFSDVDSGTWYAPFVCSAKEDGVIQGYSGNLFKAEQKINVVEASKIIALTLGVPLSETVTGTAWYSPYVETLGDLNVYPTSLRFWSQKLTRGELAEMLWRLELQKTTEAATAWEDFSSACSEVSSDLPDTVDLSTVRDTWLSWMNATRAAQGLPAYTLNDQLSRSATLWAQTNKSRGGMSHKRSGTAYYDYYAIQDWFADLGLTFKNDASITFTENIGYGPYSCSDSDCTDDVLEAIAYTYDYFVSEAGKSYAPHWNSIVSSHFKEVGFGLTLDNSHYYLTVHYGTAITSDPPPLCNDL